MSRTKLRNVPIRGELGKRIGAGKDNSVYPIIKPSDKSLPRTPIEAVVKISHDSPDANTRGRDQQTALETARRGVLYKHNKYHLLRHFLSDYIPQSLLVLTQVEEGGKKRYAEMTLQRHIDGVRLDQLTPEQRRDPRLRTNLSDLVTRLRYLYTVLNEANEAAPPAARLDAKLDLGGISNSVKSADSMHVFSEAEVDAIIESNSSPNILIDTVTMHPYCIDFDQGQWVPEMDQTLEHVYQIDARNRMQAQAMGNLALPNRRLYTIQTQRLNS